MPRAPQPCADMRNARDMQACCRNASRISAAASPLQLFGELLLAERGPLRGRGCKRPRQSRLYAGQLAAMGSAFWWALPRPAHLVHKFPCPSL